MKYEQIIRQWFIPAGVVPIWSGYNREFKVVNGVLYGRIVDDAYPDTWDDIIPSKMHPAAKQYLRTLPNFPADILK